MNLYNFLKTIYKNSMLCKLFAKISDAYHSCFFFSEKNDSGLSDRLAANLSNKECDNNTVRNAGVIFTSMYRAAERFVRISTREVAILLSFFFCAVATSALIDGNQFKSVVFYGLTVVSLPFLFVKSSLQFLICDSFIGKFFGLHTDRDPLKQNKTLLCIIGSLLIVGGVYLPTGYALLIGCLPLIPLLLVYVKPIVYIGLILFSIPVFGTSVCMVLSFVLFLSHGLHRLYGTVQKQKFSYVDILLLVFAVLCLFASFGSYTIGESVRIAIMWITLFATVFVVYRHIRTVKNLVSVLSALLIGAGVSCFIGLFQYLSGQIDTTWTDTALFENLSIRIYSTFANPNVFGEFLLLIIPISVGLALYFSKSKYRIACFLMAGVAFANLALTYSRGCYVGIAVTAVVFLWMYNKKLFGWLLVIGIPVGIKLMPQNMIDRIMSMTNFADSSTSYRLQIYRGTLSMLEDFWPSGLGIGDQAFNYAYPYYGTQNVVAPHSHSLFFQLMVTFGVAGLIYMVFTMILYHRSIFSAMHRQPKKSKNRILLILFASVLSGFFVQSVFDYTWYNYRIYMLFWLVMILGFAVSRILKDGKKYD